MLLRVGVQWNALDGVSKRLCQVPHPGVGRVLVAVGVDEDRGVAGEVDQTPPVGVVGVDEGEENDGVGEGVGGCGGPGGVAVEGRGGWQERGREGKRGWRKVVELG